MSAGKTWAAITGGLVLGAALAGCGALDPTNLLNPNFLSALGGSAVASLPGNAPGVLVTVQNGTDRWAALVVSYRDNQGNAQAYTTTLAPGDKSATVLTCPVAEITLGDLTNLQASGAQVYLSPPVAADPSAAPFIQVDAFGVLLRNQVNYSCGDGITFTVQPSSAAQSGYQVIAYFRSGGA
jgi:hypothetical protein